MTARKPVGFAVPLYLYPNGISANSDDFRPDVWIDADGEQWLALLSGWAPWFGPLPLAFSEEAAMARLEAQP